MRQLIYRSQPFGFDESILAGILIGARRNNARDDITGALICRQDLYLQLIEGPDNAIDGLYARILNDDRHCDVRLLVAEQVESRIFPEWTMLDDTAPSLIWSSDEAGGGGIEDSPAAVIRAVFERIARTARDADVTPEVDTA